MAPPRTLPETLQISISGIRGIVGRTLTDERVCDFAKAFALFSKRGKMVVAQDTRPSGHRFRRKIIQGLREIGCSVVDIGVSPTPTVLFMVRFLHARGGVVVTASHNPSKWNGLKFVGEDGQFLDQKKMDSFLRIGSSRFFPASRRRGPRVRNRSALARHIQQVLRHLNVQKIRSCRFRVAIDPCNGTGAVVTAPFLRRLGCRVTAINNRPNGRFAHPPEPREENLQQLSRCVKKSGAQIGFAQDPDADRLAIVTEKGTPLSGEYTLALAVQHILSRRRSPVVINLSTSRMVEEVARQKGVKVYRSKIGERHVVEKMRKVKAAIGGEGNGGVIYPTINPARDSLVGMGLILESLSERNRPLSELVEALPHYEMVQKKLTLSKARSRALLKALPKRFKGGKVNRLDGIRIDFKDRWIHARPSNTEPVLRLIAEAPTKQGAVRLLQQAT
ncbi:MAG: phosphoglucosamine mutase [Candidatus Omnitrophica bacterium]|nr:phosphoglucosamine mutase [Candidatus Omnitrophota bacterium]